MAPSVNGSGHKPFMLVMLGSSPAGVAYIALIKYDRDIAFGSKS